MKAIVQRAYGSPDVLAEIPAAVAYVGEGHARGKVVVMVGSSEADGGPIRA